MDSRGKAVEPSGMVGVGDGHISLGEFLLLRKLGEGGMGVVFKARQTRRQRDVALKVLRRKLSQDPAEVEQFYREARLLGALHHPNIVRPYAVGRKGGFCFLAMEYVEGPSCRQLLEKKGRFPVEEAARIGIEVLRALDYAHRKGLIHRDIKPDNILIRATDGCVKLTDFGLARLIRTARRRPGPPVAFGTLHYMPPEQIEDPEAADVRSDLYAFGSTLYHLITGLLPFPGETALEVLHAKRSLAPAPPSRLAPAVSPDLDRFILTLLEPEPDRRPTSAAVALDDLAATGLAADYLRWCTGKNPTEESAERPTAWDLPALAAGQLAKWYLRIFTSERGWELWEGTTEEVEEWLRTGRIGSDTLASWGDPSGGFRPIGTFSVFQSVCQRSSGARKFDSSRVDLVPSPKSSSSLHP